MVSKCTMIDNIVKPIMLEPSIIMIIRERVSIFVQWYAIYVFICMYVRMYSFVYGTFTRESTNYLDYVTNSTLHVGGSSPD